MSDTNTDEGRRDSLSGMLLPVTARPQRRRLLFFGLWGSIVLGVLILFRGVLLPFLLAIIVAYVLAPVVKLVERAKIGSFSLKRWMAVIVVYISLLAAIGIFTAIGVPRLVVETERLASEAPAAVQEVKNQWLPWIDQKLRSTMGSYGAPPIAKEENTEVPDARIHIEALDEDKGWAVELPEDGIVIVPDGKSYVIKSAHHHEDSKRLDLATTLTDAVRRMTDDTKQTAVTVLKTAQTFVRALVRGVFTFFITLMLSAYLLITSDGIRLFFRSLSRPKRRRAFDRLLLRIDKGLSGVVRGQLLICLVNGILSGIGFYIFDLKYWPILTLVATVLSIIPIFGAILSSIPAVIIALQVSPTTAFLILLWIVGIHQIEANLLNPKILGDAAHVHPVMVVFALLAGEHLFGLAGALLAVPVLSITQSLFLHYREVMLGVPKPRGAADTSQPTPPPLIT